MIRRLQNEKNADIFINSLGVTIPAQGTIDCDNLDFQVLCKSEIFDFISAGELSLLTGNATITNGEHAKQYFNFIANHNKENFSASTIQRLNPTATDFAILANVFRADFVRNFEDSEHYQNVFLAKGNDFRSIKHASDIELIDDSFRLCNHSSTSFLDSCNSIENVILSPINSSTTNFELRLSTPATKWEIIAQDVENENQVVVQKYCSSCNWTKYKRVHFELKVNTETSVALVINNEIASNWIHLAPCEQEIVFDIANTSRHAVTSYGVCICCTTNNAIINCNNISLSGDQDNNYSLMGELVFIPTSFAPEYVIEELLFCPNEYVFCGTGLDYQISLDAGKNWHSLQACEISKWLNVDELATAFECKNKPQIKIIFLTTQPYITPILDNFFLMYRLKRSL